jgi:hypothetical protein
VLTVGQNHLVTASRGATTSNLEAAAQHIPADEPTEAIREDYVGRNAAMRREFLACNARIQEARLNGDTAAEHRARADRERIASSFVELNTRLAVRGAAPFRLGRSQTVQDHVQAALLGLWEGFVGVDSSTVDDVIAEEDGTLSPAAGWNPDKGTFSTWAGSHIAGRVMRSVKSSEPAYAGMSYGTWTAKPRIDAARSKLATDLGRTPSIAEIAEAAKVSTETVRAASKPTPVSLQTAVGDDGSTTLGDLITDQVEDVGFDLSPQAEATLVQNAAGLTALELLALLLRTGITGRPQLTVVRTADTLGVGRGVINNAMTRAKATLGLTDLVLDA